MSSSIHANNKTNDILLLGEGLTQGLDDTTLTAEKYYSINFTKSNKRFYLSLHYNGTDSDLLVNGTEIHKFKAKKYKIEDYGIMPSELFLGNVSNGFSVDDMKKTGLYGNVYDFSIDSNTIAVNDILDIHKYLIVKYNIK